MIEIRPLLTELAWPLALLLAWIAGEIVNRRLHLPRISVYAISGFALAHIGLLPPAPSMLLLANIAFGLILFEAGHRINLAWFKTNPWLAATSLVESALTFAAIYVLACWFALPQTTCVLLAALAMATSPATIVRVVNEQHSTGQVTERALHLSALNCVLAVFVFKIVVGLVVFETSGHLWQAAYSSLVVLSASAALGALFGIGMPALLRALRPGGQDATLAFAIAVILLVTLTHGLKLSPVLATLTFGLLARHRRVVLGHAQRGFGALGDLFSLILFVFVAACIQWDMVWSGLAMGLAIVLARQLAKIAGVTLLAHCSGISWRKGALTGVAMAPISAFVILTLEQTRHLGVDLFDQLAPLAAAALLLEVSGPMLTQLALRLAAEIPAKEN